MFYQQRIRGIDTTTENQLKKENDNMSQRNKFLYLLLTLSGYKEKSDKVKMY